MSLQREDSVLNIIGSSLFCYRTLSSYYLPFQTSIKILYQTMAGFFGRIEQAVEEYVENRREDQYDNSGGYPSQYSGGPSNEYRETYTSANYDGGYAGDAYGRDAYDRQRDNYDNSNGYDRNQYPTGYAPAVADCYATVRRELQQLVRPHVYKHHRPSFYSAYSRAAHRYGFESGRYAGFAKRNNAVVKVRGLYDKEADHEVAASSVQNGEFLVGA